MRKKNKLYDIKRPIHLYDGLTEATQNIDVSGHGILGDPTKINIGAISSMKTPKIGGIGGGMGDLASGIGTAVGKIGGSLIGGGLQSGAGSAISNIGGAAAGIVGKFNPVAGAIVGAASGVLGGLTNRLFGSKLNEENIATLKKNIDKTQNTNFGGSYDDINNQYLQSSSIGAFDNSYIGKDGVFSHKARNLANELRLQSQGVNDYQADKYTNAIDTTNQDLFNKSMYNVAAFGGSLFNNGGIMIKKQNRGKFTESADRAGMGVQEYARHILANKDNYSPTMIKRAVFAHNANNWHANGGELNNYNNFFTEINNGGTHEQNPNNGVQIGNDSNGVPNLVEQGETIYNDYVYSNRLKLPKDIQKKYNLGDITFAEASKKFAKATKEMPNDSIARRTLNSQLNELKDSQEELKAKKERAKQLRAFNKLTPNEKLGLMQMAMNNAPIGEENNQGEYNNQDIYNNQQEDISQGYALGGNLFKYGDSVDKVNNKMNFLQSLYGLNNTDYINKNISPWNYENMWNDIPTFTNSKLKGNIPYMLNPISKGYNVRQIESKPDYKEFTNLQDKPLSYWENLHDRTNKDIDFLQTNYNRLRNDDLLGNVHITPDKRMQIYQPLDKYGVELPYDTVNMIDNYNDIGSKVDENGNIVTYLSPNNSIDTSNIPNPTPNPIITTNPITQTSSPIGEKNKERNKDKNNLYPTWMRYAPIVGSAIGLGTSLFSKPDESSANAILNAGKEAGKFIPVNFNPIGDYIRYNPFDRDYYINQLNAQSGATRRNIINTSGGNRGAMMAGLLSADNNAQNQLGQLARQAEEYNDAQRIKVAEFNRGTNQYNSEGLLKAAMANQSALINSRNTFLNATMQAERLRQAARQQLAAERSANFTNLFNNIGNLGRENMNFNILNNSPAYTWAMSKDGQQAYKSWLKENKKACGGKLNKKGGKK